MVGQGSRSPVASSTTARNRIENGNPNKKRMLVAPQVPSGPVNCRCMALRATWAIAAVIVKGIQSEVIPNIGGKIGFGTDRRLQCLSRFARSTQVGQERFAS